MPSDATASPSAPEPFVHDVLLDHPPGAVWAAITRKELVDRYYFAPLGEDVVRAGADIYYGLPTNKMIVGSIVACEPPRQLVHTFRFVGDDESPDTVVTYALEPSGAGTRLRVEHRGYATDSQGYADVSMGWPIILDQLKDLLDGKR